MAATDGESERRKLLSRAGIVGAGTLVSRVLGLVRTLALAALFSKAETDAFWLAFTIPNALRQLLAEGGVSGAVVPVLAGKLNKEGPLAARSFFAKMRGASLLALTITCALGIALARPLTALYTHDAHQRPADFGLAVELTRVVFPYLFFMGTAALGMAALNANRKFAVAALAPGLLNVGMLAAVVALPAPLEHLGIARAHAMTLGALLGGLLQVLAQWPALRAIGYADVPRLDVRDPDVREVFRRIGPMMLGIGIYQVDLVLSRGFLWELGEGANSYFSWAMQLCEFPQSIFVLAIATTALPSLSTFVSDGNMEDVKKTFAYGMRLTMFVAIPASVGLVVLAEPVVVTLFQRGRFDAIAAHETARALVWQGGALWTVAAVRQLVPVFFALGNTRIPVLVSGLDLGVFVVLAVVLRGPMGHVGISAAVAGSSAAQMVLLFVALKWRLGEVRLGEIASSALRVLGASLIAAAAGFWTARIVTVATGLVSVAVFGVVFFVSAWMLKAKELDPLAAGLRRRFGRKR
jgi:putative peptidoglycan lipid II flippase